MFILHLIFDTLKIIIKARKNYLFEQYKAKSPQVEQLITDVQTALAVIEDKLAHEDDKDKKEMYNRMIIKVQTTLKEYAESKRQDPSQLLEDSTDVLSTWLDKCEGQNVTDNSIFNKLPRHYEGEFHKDMAALNVNIFVLLQGGLKN